MTSWPDKLICWDFLLLYLCTDWIALLSLGMIAEKLSRFMRVNYYLKRVNIHINLSLWWKLTIILAFRLCVMFCNVLIQMVLCRWYTKVVTWNSQLTHKWRWCCYHVTISQSVVVLWRRCTNLSLWSATYDRHHLVSRWLSMVMSHSL